MEKKVNLIIYKWAGAWGPFKVNIPCGECSLTKDVVQDTLDNELSGIPVNLEIREWLTEWWKPLKHLGWHAPIVIVDDKLISQGKALNRGVLAEAIINAHTKKSELQGNKLYGKETCPHCKRAKEYLQQTNTNFEYFDVVKNSTAMYEMLSRVKPIIGPKKPVTVPQIWLKGEYIGGADHLEKILQIAIEPNEDRGQCSLSPGSITNI